MKKIIAALGVILGLMFVLAYRLARPCPAVVLVEDQRQQRRQAAVGLRLSTRPRRPASVSPSDCRRVTPPRTPTAPRPKRLSR